MLGLRPYFTCWFLFILGLLKGSGLLSPEHLKVQRNRKVTFTITKCYLFHRITLQKQPQLYEATSISLGTEAMWMKMGISGLLRDRMMSYYPLGNFFICAYVFINWSPVFRNEPAAHLYKFLLYVLLPSYRIGPFEVECVLAEHPAVAESAVVSSPDPIRGEVQEWIHLHFIMC